MTLTRFSVNSKISQNKSNLIDALVSLFVFALIVIILFSPAKYAGKVLEGLLLFCTSVLPGLFPFMFLTKILTGLSSVKKLSDKCGKLTQKLFNSHGLGAYSLLMSCLSGYPVGAKIVGDLHSNNLISDTDAQKMVTFSMTSGPAFVVGTVGGLMLGNATAGIVILASHLISNLLTGMIFCKSTKFNTHKHSPTQSNKNLSSQNCFVTSKHFSSASHTPQHASNKNQLSTTHLDTDSHDFQKQDKLENNFDTNSRSFQTDHTLIAGFDTTKHSSNKNQHPRKHLDISEHSPNSFRDSQNNFNKVEKKQANIDKILSDSMFGAVQSILIVGGFISVFYCFCEILIDLRVLEVLAFPVGRLLEILGAPADMSKGLVTGIIEVTRGCKELSNFFPSFPALTTSFASALISFSGLSIILQSKAFLSGTKIKTHFLIFTKSVHAIISFFVCLILSNVFF